METEEFQCESCNLGIDSVQEQGQGLPLDSAGAGKKITLYSTGCPKCKVIETKLKQSNTDFNLITDTDTVLSFGKANGINSAPILVVEDNIMDFSKAVAFIRGLK